MVVTSWEGIFPIPVLRTNIDREFTDEERNYFARTQENTCANVFNTRTASTYVLDAAELRSVRSFIEEHVKIFGRRTISVSKDVEFYITQSWINFTKPGESHHKHVHTNSLISGVLYLNAIKDTDKIYFYKDVKAMLNVWNPEANWYTADSWFFSVGSGDLILFPSSLAHGVEETKGSHIRVSLSFNAFVRGDLGAEEHLNRLRL